jgi:hypothetical protein
MSGTNRRKELLTLKRIALEDLVNTPDSELLREAAEEGLDITDIAKTMRAAMQESAATELRQRLILAREKIQRSHFTQKGEFSRPSIGSIKTIVKELFQKNPKLGLAFRDGRTQTDEDWISLYDDLVKMGEVDPNGRE